MHPGTAVQMSDGAREVPDERPLRQWIGQLRAGWVALVAGLALGLAIAVGASATQQKVYRAQGTLVLSPQKAFLNPRSSAYVTRNVMKSVPGILWSPLVLEGAARGYVARAPDERVAARRRREATARWVRDRVRAETGSDSMVVSIVAEGGSREDALDLSESVVNSMTSALRGREPAQILRAQPDPPAVASVNRRDAGIAVRVYSRGESEGQVTPSTRRNALIGLNVGLLIGVPAALLLGGWRAGRARRLGG